MHIFAGCTTMVGRVNCKPWMLAVESIIPSPEFAGGDGSSVWYGCNSSLRFALVLASQSMIPFLSLQMFLGDCFRLL